ncbi:hypothetical protein [Krasilnikovia sp. M28-CT-15]|uniref:hypothetical protein n=1 Tax=Krasilnikovia sp. M28-CT-15 TaxID=3373540 RepID=UPI003876DAC6
MKVVVAWWDLDASTQTIESLRSFLRDEAVDAWSGLTGLRLKLWVADRRRNRWGAVQVWQSDGDLQQPLPMRAAELIGYPPTHREVFDLEAAVGSLTAENATDSVRPVAATDI